MYSKLRRLLKESLQKRMRSYITYVEVLVRTTELVTGFFFRALTVFLQQIQDSAG